MIDARMFTVGPVQENCFIVRRKDSDRAVMVDPGEESERLLEALDALGVKMLDAILLTHTHFDHIGAVAPVARATGSPVYCPELETQVLADIMNYVPWPGFGPFESYEADRTVAGGEKLELAGLEFDVLFTPGHSPGHVTYALASERALFSGDVLFQGSVGRVDLPGGDWPTLLSSIESLLERYPDETTVYPGHMGVTTLGRERATNPFLRELAANRVIRAPRGTFDVLPPDAARRRALEAHAERILGAAGYGRIETPTFEATELFARGVGEATDIVRKEMYTFDDGAGRSLALRPEGTAPVCRAYIEHGMHKLPQPVKLWYLSSFFRAEAPQKGRYRQFWQVGAEAIGSAAPETDAELIVLLADLLDAVGARGVRLRLSSLGTPETRSEYREELQQYLRAREDRLSEDARERIDQNPLRAFDAADHATREVMRDAPLLLDRLDPEDAAHFVQVRELLDSAGLAYEIDPTLVRGLDYYTRTVFEFESEVLGAQSGVGGGGRYDALIEQLDGPPTPACGFAAGVERMLLAAGGSAASAEQVDLFVALAKPGGAGMGFELSRAARRAGLSAQLELAGRSLKGQLKHADRIGARYVAIVGEDGSVSLRDMSSGQQQELDAADVVRAVQGL